MMMALFGPPMPIPRWPASNNPNKRKYRPSGGVADAMKLFEVGLLGWWRGANVTL